MFASEQTATAAASHSIDHCPGWLVTILEGVQTVSDLVGIGVISIGLLIAIGSWLTHEVGRFAKRSAEGMERWNGMRSTRMVLGNYILLGLEFMIVSDIIHSFLQPDFLSLSTLGVLVLIRTMISFFLGKELEAVRIEEDSETPNIETANV